MEKLQFDKRDNVLLILMLSTIFGCTNKSDHQSQLGHANPETLYYDAKNVLNMKIKHGDSTQITLSYGGPNVIEKISYNRGGTEGFLLGFGQNDIAFPSHLVTQEASKSKKGLAYYFDENSGMIITISQSMNGQPDGPYYLFGKSGILKVSGFYKDGSYIGIWHHYDINGKIIETINADSIKINVLKHFGLEG